MNRFFTILLILLIISFFIKDVGAEQEGASLRIGPQTGTFFVDSTFDISIILNTNKNRINAVQVDIKFPPDKLQLVTPLSGKRRIISRICPYRARR